MIDLALKYAQLIQIAVMMPISIWTTWQLVIGLLAKWTDSKTIDRLDEEANN